MYGGAVAAAGAAGLGGYGFFQSNHPEIKRLALTLPRLPEALNGFTVAQLSDFHYESHFSVVPIRKAVEAVNDLHPDLIVLTGDFVTVPILAYRSRSAKSSADAAEPCADLLRGLRAPHGRVAVLGNHDASSDSARIAGALISNDITVLRNRSIPIERSGARFWLAGIDDALEGVPDLSAAIAQVPREEAVVLLAHEPDFADDAAGAGVDLQLSGHSHGGQVWIPGIGAPWLPPMGKKYPRGMYTVRGLPLYTNIGIGTIRVPIRLNCPPEITLITLKSGVRQSRASQKNPNRL